MSIRLTEMNKSFQATKAIGISGEFLANGVLQILADMDTVLTEFIKVVADDQRTADFFLMSGAEGMEYASAVAQILGKAKYDIEALG